jgi:hypothetical protein
MYIFLKKNHIDTFGNTLYDLRIKHYTPFGDKWQGYLRVFVLRMFETTRNVRRVEQTTKSIYCVHRIGRLRVVGGVAGLGDHR